MKLDRDRIASEDLRDLEPTHNLKPCILPSTHIIKNTAKPSFRVRPQYKTGESAVRSSAPTSLDLAASYNDLLKTNMALI